MFENVKFVKSIDNIKNIPNQNYPEIILCGRSNVGKSSFINSLFNRKNLAKISSSPGKTRTINYYSVEDKLYFVDLPGFGYAKASKKEREKWGQMINEFIEHSPNITLAFHFIDSRHKPTELDVQLNEMLKYYGIPFIVILNKVDKLKQSEISRSQKDTISEFPELSPGDNLLIYSAVKKTGKKNVIKRISHLL